MENNILFATLGKENDQVETIIAAEFIPQSASNKVDIVICTELVTNVCKPQQPASHFL